MFQPSALLVITMVHELKASHFRFVSNDHCQILYAPSSSPVRLKKASVASKIVIRVNSKHEEFGTKWSKMLEYHSRRGTNFEDFYNSEQDFPSITKSQFRHSKMSKYIAASAYNLIQVFNKTGGIAGSIVVNNLKKVHSVVNWMEKASNFLKDSTNFSFYPSVEGYVIYENCVNELSHFMEVRLDTGDSCGCNLEFGWLSIRCLPKGVSGGIENRIF